MLCAFIPAVAAGQGYPGYPYTIMTSERSHHQGVARHANAKIKTAPETAAVTQSQPQPQHPSLLGREKFISKLHRRGFYAARGSSGSVLPTPLPRTQLIPPEGGGALTLPPLQQEQGPTMIPGTAKIIPNLPHGPETFQDRASRCSFQSGLYDVPGTLRNRYMGACVSSSLATHIEPSCRPCAGHPRLRLPTTKTWMAGRRRAKRRRSSKRLCPAMTKESAAYYRKLALILSSADEPGHSSFSPSELSGASTVFKWLCRSAASSSTNSKPVTIWPCEA